MLNFYFNRKSFFFRLSIICTGFFFIFILQMVKPNFRAQLSENVEVNKTEIFFNLITDKLFGDQALFSNEDIANNVTRINQGWIISNVMHNIPVQRPFANGQTLKDALTASIFPRFLYPDKPMAGGQFNMENYAGIILNENTSMDISQVGEAYANFGVMGGIVMMFFLGLFFNWVITFIEKRCLKYPELVLWIPLVFLQVIKAETSLITVLNHLVKASLVTWFFFSPWGLRVFDLTLNKWRFGTSKFTLFEVNPIKRGVRPRKGHRKRKKY